MDILKLIYEIRMTENGEQKFRNRLFEESSKIELKSEDVIQNTFGELRKIIVNNINVTDVYEAMSEKWTYKNVMCDSFFGSQYQIKHTYEYKKGKLIYKDLKVFTFTVNANITIKNILSNLAYS